MGLIPAGSTQSYLDMDGGRVRVLRSTATPADSLRRPLLLLHGGGADNAAISWYEVFEPWGTEREVIAIDLPGFGRTQGIQPVGGAHPKWPTSSPGPPTVCGYHSRAASSVCGWGATLRSISLCDIRIWWWRWFSSHRAASAPVFATGSCSYQRGWRHKLSDWLLIPLGHLANRRIDLAIRAVGQGSCEPLPPARGAGRVFRAGGPETESGISVCAVQPASLGPFSMRNNLLPVVGRVPARPVLPR